MYLHTEAGLHAGQLLQAHTHALGTLETFYLRGGGPSTSPLSHGEK